MQQIRVPYPYTLRISSATAHLATVLDNDRNHNETDAMLSNTRILYERLPGYELSPYAHTTTRGTVNHDYCWPAWRSLTLGRPKRSQRYHPEP